MNPPGYFFFFLAAAFLALDFLACECAAGAAAFFPGRC